MEERQEYEIKTELCVDVGRWMSYAIVMICHISRIQVKRHTSVFNNCHLVQAYPFMEHISILNRKIL